PCIRLRKEVFESETFKTLADTSLVLLNADFPRKNKNQLPKELRAKNDALAEKYNRSGQFPLTLILTADGEVVRSWEGFPKDGLTTFGRGDWVPVKSTSNLEYTSSVYFYVDADILAKTARLFHKQTDYLFYSALAEKIRKAINAKFFDSVKVSYCSGVQTELSMALQWNVVDERYKLQLAENLAKRVTADGMHIDVGVLGAKAILNALSDNRQAETAYKLASQDTYPGWGWWIVNGATTLHENWDMQATRDISDNHMMFGEIGGWFFKGIGGIKIDEKQPGFKNILLKPHFVQGLSHFTASHKGPYGTIVSSWKRNGKSINYDVKIPANSSATLTIDEIEGKKVYLNDKLVGNNFELAAGKYSFEIK
ncbi:MAG: hypothetical protein EOO20_27340, partial [Chryseobacterium sp.]